MKRQELDPKNTKIELSVRVVSHLLHSFEADYGRDELVKFMNKTGLPVEYFENEFNWVSFEYYCNLLKKLVEYTGDENIAFKYGLNATKYVDTWGIWKTVLTLIPSSAYIFKTIVKINPRYSKLVKLQILDSKKNKIVIESQLKDEYKQDRNNCLNLQGQLTSIPLLFGLPAANVKELQCAAEGADSCIHEITWQRFSFKKNKFFSLLIGLSVVCIIYITIKWNIISAIALAKTALFLIPVAFYLGGHIFDYKRAIRENSEILDEQNQAVIDSLNNTQELNEDLQIKIDQRTEELKATHKKLDATLEQISKSEKKLIITERLTGVARLAAGVAHEINNPMGAVRNYLQEILEEMPDKDSRKVRLEDAEKATDESKTLINDLLSFARMDEDLYIIEIDINEVIDNITRNLQQTFKNFNIKINKDLDPDLPILNSDPLQINQVFTNLIINAYNAIKEKGEIYIKTSRSENQIRVDIQDNGEIIPSNIIDKIFDPYQREPDGIGRKDLGLLMSHNIVKRFNGDIKINSTVENGTTFNVIIPYS